MRSTLLQGLLPPLTEAAPGADDPELAGLAAAVKEATERTLGRSLAIRHVDAGSCNGCELEIHALGNAFYDIERFGFRFVASPRHADVLLVTGPVTLNMREALERTYAATPAPKWVVACGACAADGGVFAGSYAVANGVARRPAGRPRHPRLPAEPGRADEGAFGADEGVADTEVTLSGPSCPALVTNVLALFRDYDINRWTTVPHFRFEIEGRRNSRGDCVENQLFLGEWLCSESVILSTT